jgi:hypothetical protein
LERKVSPMGRDRIDHPSGAHDDLANAAVGARLSWRATGSSYDNSMNWVRGDEPLLVEEMRPLVANAKRVFSRIRCRKFLRVRPAIVLLGEQLIASYRLAVQGSENSPSRRRLRVVVGRHRCDHVRSLRSNRFPPGRSPSPV